MFVALELVRDEARGLGQKLRRLLAPPKASLEEASALGGRYYLIRAPLYRGEADWGEIEELAGRLGRRMLLPDDWVPPPDSPLEALACPGFDRQVLLATACQLVARTRMPVYRRVVGLLDPAGDSAHMLPALLRHAAMVRVFSHNLPVYRQAAERMMEEMGAPVLVGDGDFSLGDCVLVVAPGACSWEEAPDFSCPVLMTGGGERPPQGVRVFSDLEAGVPGELAGLAPPGISPHRFAGALYEFCGVGEAGPAARLRYNYRRCSLAEGAMALLEGAAPLCV